MMYCYNEKTADLKNREKRKKPPFFQNPLVASVGGSGCRTCLVSVGGKEVDDEGECHISCG